MWAVRQISEPDFVKRQNFRMDLWLATHLTCIIPNSTCTRRTVSLVKNSFGILASGFFALFSYFEQKNRTPKIPNEFSTNETPNSYRHQSDFYLSYNTLCCPHAQWRAQERVPYDKYKSSWRWYKLLALLVQTSFGIFGALRNLVRCCLQSITKKNLS